MLDTSPPPQPPLGALTWSLPPHFALPRRGLNPKPREQRRVLAPAHRELPPPLRSTGPGSAHDLFRRMQVSDDYIFLGEYVRFWSGAMSLGS